MRPFPNGGEGSTMVQVAEERQTVTGPTPYELVGGEAGVRRLVERFYDVMDQAPEAAGIRAMHAADLEPMRQRLFEYLSGWLGGPPLYFQRPDAACIRSAHAKFPIGPDARDEWMFCMRRAIEDTDMEPAIRAPLERALANVADMLRTS
jgi:hemoglobin